MNDLNRNNDDTNRTAFIIAGLAIIAVVLGYVFMPQSESERMNTTAPVAGDMTPSQSDTAPPERVQP